MMGIALLRHAESYPPLSAPPTSPPQGGRVAAGRLTTSHLRSIAARAALSTSPLRGEVAAKPRVGVTRSASSTRESGFLRGTITPPRSCAPTLPLKGRVKSSGIPAPLAPLVGEMPGRAEGGKARAAAQDGGLHG
jgi:hypothetical protein